MQRSSHIDRGSALFLAASRHNSSKFPEKELIEASRSSGRPASPVSLLHFQRQCETRRQTVGGREEMHWVRMQSPNYQSSNHSCYYEKGNNWASPSDQEREQRHIGDFNAIPPNYPESINASSSTFLQGRNQYERGVPTCTSPAAPQHPSHRNEERFMTYPKEHDDEMKKSKEKFPWMKNTKSHHYEWKSQWERGR